MQQIDRLYIGGLFTLLRIQVDQPVGVLHVHPAADSGNLADYGGQPDQQILRLPQGIGRERAGLRLHIGVCRGRPQKRAQLFRFAVADIAQHPVLKLPRAVDRAGFLGVPRTRRGAFGELAAHRLAALFIQL